MTPHDFDQIGRVAKLAVLSAIFSSLVADDLEAAPDVSEVRISGMVRPDGLELAYQLIGPGGQHVGEVAL